jgi:exodeoxyribonuclease VII large subunit
MRDSMKGASVVRELRSFRQRWKSLTQLPGEKLAARILLGLAVAGEITDWVIARSGHAYFSLKDENALLPCVMWRSSLNKLKFEAENGMAVVIRGYIDVYPPQGKYQFYAESMAPEGVGALQLAFEQMVAKLRAEGLFDEEHKKKPPGRHRRRGTG